jgi:hypothetical protein
LRWTPAGQVRSRNSARRLSIGAASNGINAGNQHAVAWAGTDDVTPSRSRLFRQSTRRLKWKRKSTPMMGRVTSATTNLHVKSWRKPKFRLRGIHQ